MIKNECEIIKDLLPSYIENLANQGTKEFVEKHIEDCEPCKETLEGLKKEKEQEKQREEQKGKFEINHLKKYNKVLEKLKKILFIITIILGLLCLLILGCVLKERIEYMQIEKEATKMQDTIFGAIESTRQIIREGQFKLTLEKSQEIGTEEETKNTYIYIGTHDKILEKMYEEDKQKTKYTRYLFKKEQELKGIHEKIGGEISLYEEPNWRIEKNIISCDGFTMLGTPQQYREIEIREEEYNNKKCKVLSRNDGKNSRYELWIEKETNLIIRDMEYIDGKIIGEKNYIWELREITDEEIFDGHLVEEIENKYFNINQKASKIENIINESYQKTEEFMKSSNYTLEVNLKNSEGEGKETYKVKGKKYVKIINSGTTIYGFIERNQLREIEIRDGKIMREGTLIGDIMQLKNVGINYMTKMKLEEYAKIELNEEEYNGKECYIISNEASKIWIDKESKLVQRYVYRRNGLSMTDDETYIWKKGNVTDEEMIKEDSIEEVKTELNVSRLLNEISYK